MLIIPKIDRRHLSLSNIQLNWQVRHCLIDLNHTLYVAASILKLVRDGTESDATVHVIFAQIYDTKFNGSV